jgi:prevent-host-death family protein
MGEPQPMTQTMKISDVRGQLNTLVNRVFRKETRVIVEKSGIPVAALVSTDDLERLDRLDRERAERFTVIDELRQAFAGVPDEELEREAERALAEVRAERRAERGQGATAR